MSSFHYIETDPSIALSMANVDAHPKALKLKLCHSPGALVGALTADMKMEEETRKKLEEELECQQGLLSPLPCTACKVIAIRNSISPSSKIIRSRN